MKLVRWGLLAGLLAGAIGCGAKTYDISGKVTFEGQPVAEGYIGFDQEGAGRGGGGAIVDGAYSVRVPPGPAKVRITASKMMPLPAGEKGMYGDKEEMRQYIPAKYNTASELSADIKGPETLNYDLK